MEVIPTGHVTRCMNIDDSLDHCVLYGLSSFLNDGFRWVKLKLAKILVAGGKIDLFFNHLVTRGTCSSLTKNRFWRNHRVHWFGARMKLVGRKPLIWCLLIWCTVYKHTQIWSTYNDVICWIDLNMLLCFCCSRMLAAFLFMLDLLLQYGFVSY